MDVIVVNYNSSSALARNLGSVVRFAGPDAKLYVVDNSGDEALAEVVGRASRDAIILTPGANIGFARAVNEALRASTSDLVLLANPDARVLSGSLGDIEMRFDTNPDAACVGVRLVNADGTVQHSCKHMPRRLTQSPRTSVCRSSDCRDSPQAQHAHDGLGDRQT